MAFQQVKNQDPYSVRAVDRATALLDVLADAEAPQSLSEAARRAGLSGPTAFRLLRTLEDSGLVLAQPGGGYTLGFRVLELAHALLRQLDIVAIARPHLTAVRNEVNETVGLLVRSGDYWVPLAAVEAAHPLRRVLDLGERSPLYADSAGKVFLAADSDDELEAYLSRTPLVARSTSTATDPAVLRRQVAEVRAAGWAVSVNERGFGGAGVSAPIYAHDGRLAAVLMIAVPASRFTDELREACVRAVVTAAREISAALGHRASREAPDRNGTIESRSVRPTRLAR